MKIYTRTGDDGTTGLIGGSRVLKSDPRIECYGTVDEVNAAIGLAAVTADPQMRSRLGEVQNDLFVIGSHLAAPDASSQQKGLPPLEESAINRLETQIDEAEMQLTPLHNFILPGGDETAARLHLARTICRRAERLIVSFSRDCPVEQTLVIYLNRLSDWLFIQGAICKPVGGGCGCAVVPGGGLKVCPCEGSSNQTGTGSLAQGARAR